MKKVLSLILAMVMLIAPAGVVSCYADGLYKNYFPKKPSVYEEDEWAEISQKMLKKGISKIIVSVYVDENEISIDVDSYDNQNKFMETGGLRDSNVINDDLVSFCVKTQNLMKISDVRLILYKFNCKLKTNKNYSSLEFYTKSGKAFALDLKNASISDAFLYVMERCLKA